jgi:hypothetical protein
MDLEEERLKRRVEEREMALRQKVKTLKDRLDELKRMSDVKHLARQHPGLAVACSIQAGMMVKRLVGGKRYHNTNDAYRTQGAAAPRSTGATAKLWDPMVAILSAVATRTALGFVSEIGKRCVSWRHDKRQSREDFQNRR